jgi:hypothetical protein
MDHIEPLVAAPAQPAVEQSAAGAEQPIPTPDQEQTADGVFTRSQAQVASTLLGISTGLGILHHLAVETFGDKPKEETPPRRKDEDEPR